MFLFYLAAAYFVGLLAARALTPPAWHTALPALLAATWLPLRRKRLGTLLLGLLLLTCGYSSYHLQRAPPCPAPALETLPEDTAGTFYGRLQKVAIRPGGGKVFDLQIHHVRRDEHTMPVCGGLRLYIETSERHFARGAELAVRARIRLPRPFGTPGEFDFPLYLAANGLQATAFIANDEGIVLLSNPEDCWPDRMRNAAGKLIDRAVPDRKQAALVRALVTGDKGGLTNDQRRSLAEMGLSHLFSISGFHLGLVGIFGYFVLLTLLRRSERLLLLIPPRRLLPVVLIPVLWSYMLLTGQALPTVRAWLAAMLTALLLWTRRRCQPIRAALAIAAVMLAVAPMSLFMPSFQLSFAGIFGILILVPRWSGSLPPMPVRQRRLWQLPMVTLAATIATAPLALWHFHIIAPAGIPSNLAAGLTIGWLAIPAGLTGLLLTPLWPEGAAVCFRCTAEVIDATLSCCDYLSKIPLLAPLHLYPSTASMLLIALLVVVFLCPPRRWRLPVLLLLLAGWLAWPASAPNALQVVALSVGQGDALLVSDRAGHHYLIDGGGSARGTFDTGERLVAPALGRLGIRELTAVVLSHDHPDHRNGLLAILKYFRVRAFWCAMPEQDIWPPLRRQLKESGIPVRTFEPGWSEVVATRDQEVAVFVPTQSTPKVNDRSLVFYARYLGSGVLLTGDLEEAGVRQLVAATPNRPVSLLKLPHHGSRNGNPAALLDHFSPSTVFTCLGYHNRFGFPHPATQKALARRGVFLWRTDLHGTLYFEARDRGWGVRTWQKGLFR